MKVNFVRFSCLSMLVIAALLTMAPAAIPDSVEYHFTLNTAPLVSSAAGPFEIDFQLNDGSGKNDGNNTASLSNFSFGPRGGPSGSASHIGGASGNLASTVTIRDSSFLNDFTQGFTPGSSLSFTLNLTTNVDVGIIPDEFTFAILDSTGSELPTKGPFDVFSFINIRSKLQIETFGSDPHKTPVAGGSPIDTGTPAATLIPPSGVPESASFVLLAIGLLMLLIERRLCDWLKLVVR